MIASRLDCLFMRRMVEQGVGKDKVKVQLDISPEAVKRLDEVKDLAGAATRAETIRSALRFYEWFVKRQKEGFRVQLVNGKETREVELV